MGDQKRWTIHLGDHVRNREGLARAGDSQERLAGPFFPDPPGKLSDGPRLISTGLKRTDDLKRPAFLPLHLPASSLRRVIKGLAFVSQPRGSPGISASCSRLLSGR